MLWDVVGEVENIFVIVVILFQCGFDSYIFVFVLDQDWWCENWCFVVVEMVDKSGYVVFIDYGFFEWFGFVFIFQYDGYVGV